MSVTAAVDRFNRRIRLARAAELARCGRLLEAAALLDTRESASEELDLLARIKVREGKFADARRLWGRCAAQSSGSTTALRCIASLEKYAAATFRRHRQLYLVLWFVWSIAVLSVVAVVTWQPLR